MLKEYYKRTKFGDKVVKMIEAEAKRTGKTEEEICAGLKNGEDATKRYHLLKVKEV